MLIIQGAVRKPQVLAGFSVGVCTARGAPALYHCVKVNGICAFSSIPCHREKAIMWFSPGIMVEEKVQLWWRLSVLLVLCMLGCLVMVKN